MRYEIGGNIMDLFDREKADKLYDLLDDLYYADTQSLEKEVVYKDKNVTICFDKNCGFKNKFGEGFFDVSSGYNIQLNKIERTTKDKE